MRRPAALRQENQPVDHTAATAVRSRSSTELLATAAGWRTHEDITERRRAEERITTSRITTR
jgi:hypothetical protein